MNLEDVIKKIISLPLEFNRVGNNKSIYSLLRDTGYFSLHDKINENNVLGVLCNYLNFVEYWLTWSEDKRSRDGWYFLKKDNNKYIVGFIGFDSKNQKYLEFDDVVSACAAFIKKEIESIRVG